MKDIASRLAMVTRLEALSAAEAEQAATLNAQIIADVFAWSRHLDQNPDELRIALKELSTKVNGTKNADQGRVMRLIHGHCGKAIQQKNRSVESRHGKALAWLRQEKFSGADPEPTAVVKAIHELGGNVKAARLGAKLGRSVDVMEDEQRKLDQAEGTAEWIRAREGCRSRSTQFSTGHSVPWMAVHAIVSMPCHGLGCGFPEGS